MALAGMPQTALKHSGLTKAPSSRSPLNVSGCVCPPNASVSSSYSRSAPACRGGASSSREPLLFTAARTQLLPHSPLRPCPSSASSLLPVPPLRAASKGSGESSDVRVFVQTIQQSGSTGNAVVFLALQGSSSMVLPVHIGEHESRALQMEIMKASRIRPLTHDVAKNIVGALGFAITRVVITDIVQNTYYARVYMAKMDLHGAPQGEEVDVDARPSDAINLAIRAGAPMFVSEKVAMTAIEPEKVLSEFAASILSTSAQSDIERSVRETLTHFEDPCVMLQLEMDLAVQEQRYEDAFALKSKLTDVKLHSQPLRLVVAMEAALADMRLEEAARLRDEYLELAQQQSSKQSSESQKRC